MNEEPARAEKAILVWEVVDFDEGGWSGTSNCACDKDYFKNICFPYHTKREKKHTFVRCP